MPERCERLSIKGLYPVAGKPDHIRAQWTGVKRCPKKGEYFLSGSTITAYAAFQDMTSEYYIARLVEVRRVTTLEIVKVL